MTKAPSPVSRELLEHHVALHDTRCLGRDTRELVCTCGIMAVVACSTCEEYLVVATRRGTFCEHAAAMLDGQEG